MINTTPCCDCGSVNVTTHYGIGSRCEACSATFNDALYAKRQAEFKAKQAKALAHVCGDDDVCQDCCEHLDMEDGYCLICDADRTEELAAAAYDHYKDFKKYGE